MGMRVVGLLGVLWLAHNTNVHSEHGRIERPHGIAAMPADAPPSIKPSRPPLRGDFPEYRPGGRARGRETFWR